MPGAPGAKPATEKAMTPTAIEACTVCGARPVEEVWLREGDAPRETVEKGIAVRSVRGVPEWAAGFAIQGVDRVARYACPRCGHVAAILARDL